MPSNYNKPEVIKAVVQHALSKVTSDPNGKNALGPGPYLSGYGITPEMVT